MARRHNIANPVIPPAGLGADNGRAIGSSGASEAMKRLCHAQARWPSIDIVIALSQGCVEMSKGQDSRTGENNAVDAVEGKDGRPSLSRPSRSTKTFAGWDPNR
ncbi:hypothetical protein CP97_04460 [Aurantiacibacter atlanticus]|uniref:Uncharacterized protein n=1 Tax=Aurantiacibacter atlanticus TaxID=1648404 RepID=A0A0H4VAE5_9SPHN|nr:hypothetical protein CP97_04460 [Aurantiacibacter atlanticus]